MLSPHFDLNRALDYSRSRGYPYRPLDNSEVMVLSRGLAKVNIRGMHAPMTAIDHETVVISQRWTFHSIPDMIEYLENIARQGATVYMLGFYALPVAELDPVKGQMNYVALMGIHGLETIE